MSVENLTAHELRLLVLLDKTRSLKEASSRLFVSMSKASRILAKLRETFGDELFIRTASGMSPTPACSRLIARVARILAEMEAMSEDPAPFSPAKLERTFHLMLHEQLFAAHFREAAWIVRRTAPGVSFTVDAVSDAGQDALKTGELDALIYPMTDRFLPGVRAQRLGEASFDLVMRRGHPWLERLRAAKIPQDPSGRFTPAGLPSDICAALTHYPKIETTIDSFGTRAPGGLDHWVFKDKLPEQRIVVWVPYVHAAAALLPGSDATMLVYAPLARRLRAELGLASVSLSFLGCDYPLGFFWHVRLEGDTALEWLKAVFVSVFARGAAEES